MATGELKDRIPPHNYDAEKAVLGAMLIGDPEAVPIVQKLLCAEDFYAPSHGKIYKSILSLHDEGGQRADILTVCSELAKNGDLEAVGGQAFVSSLTNEVYYTSANVEYHAKIVQDCAFRRAILHVSADLNLKSYDISEEAYKLLETAQSYIFDLIERKRTVEFKTLHDTIRLLIDSIEERKKNKKEFTGIPSGFRKLDLMTSGFQNGEMIVIGARPSVGKTAIALNMATHIALHEKKPVAFFTLEMSAAAITERIAASVATVDSYSIKTGHLSTMQTTQLFHALELLYETDFSIIDSPNMQLLDLRTEARKLCSREKNPVEIIFIDYMGLITTQSYEHRFDQVSDISRSLKSLARELKIPIVILAQLSRNAQNERPHLASLRDSGSIEQDADVVMFLHRKEEKKAKGGEEAPAETQNPEQREIELIVAKQRNGDTGEVQLAYRGKYLQFLELASGP
ncbi:MAG: replicative DNA helicase [Termitinemataceae bacterium]|nr:MAG: replicative DNA helicase [Termitinemataceae bacterium]